MKKNYLTVIGLALLLLLTSSLSYLLGARSGVSKGLSEALQQHEKIRLINDVGLYGAYRNAAKAIWDGQIDVTNCEVRLLASSKYDDLRQCVSRAACRQLLSKDLEKSIPEIFGKNLPPFAYVPVSAEGKRVCIK